MALSIVCGLDERSLNPCIKLLKSVILARFWTLNWRSSSEGGITLYVQYEKNKVFSCAVVGWMSMAVHHAGITEEDFPRLRIMKSWLLGPLTPFLLSCKINAGANGGIYEDGPHEVKRENVNHNSSPKAADISSHAKG